VDVMQLCKSLVKSNYIVTVLSLYLVKDGGGILWWYLMSVY